MTIKGLRFRGETYVRLDDVARMLRKDALTYISCSPLSASSPKCQAAAQSIAVEADKLENIFREWKTKADDVEFKKRNV